MPYRRVPAAEFQHNGRRVDEGPTDAAEPHVAAERPADEAPPTDEAERLRLRHALNFPASQDTVDAIDRAPNEGEAAANGVWPTPPRSPRPPRPGAASAGGPPTDRAVSDRIDDLADRLDRLTEAVQGLADGGPGQPGDVADAVERLLRVHDSWLLGELNRLRTSIDSEGKAVQAALVKMQTRVDHALEQSERSAQQVAQVMVDLRRMVERSVDGGADPAELLERVHRAMADVGNRVDRGLEQSEVSSSLVRQKLDELSARFERSAKQAADVDRELEQRVDRLAARVDRPLGPLEQTSGAFGALADQVDVSIRRAEHLPQQPAGAPAFPTKTMEDLVAAHDAWVLAELGEVRRDIGNAEVSLRGQMHELAAAVVELSKRVGSRPLRAPERPPDDARRWQRSGAGADPARRRPGNPGSG